MIPRVFLLGVAAAKAAQSSGKTIYDPSMWSSCSYMDPYVGPDRSSLFGTPPVVAFNCLDITRSDGGEVCSSLDLGDFLGVSPQGTIVPQERYVDSGPCPF